MVIFSITTQSFVIAQEPLPTNLMSYASNDDVLVPGVSCGIADSTKARACCISDEDIAQDEPPGLLERVSKRLGLSVISNSLEKKREFGNELNALKRKNLKNAKRCLSGEPQFYQIDPAVPKTINNCTCVDPKTDENDAVTKMCKKYLYDGEKRTSEKERLSCISCAQTSGYWSSFGCIPLNMSDLISKVILNVGIGLGGFIAVMCVTLNAIRLQLSRGDSSKIQSVRENMTSCILGLILILFSVFILRIVDITILGGIFGG